MPSTSVVQIRTKRSEQFGAHPTRARVVKPVKQRGWDFNVAHSPPGVDPEDNMWRSRHRVERAVAEFFRRNPLRRFFVASIKTVPLRSPDLSLAERVVVAHYDSSDCCGRIDRHLWTAVVKTNDATYRFYSRQVDEDTAHLAFDLLAKAAEISNYTRPLWGIPFNDWESEYDVGTWPNRPGRSADVWPAQFELPRRPYYPWLSREELAALDRFPS
jgi:hypothetical protein